LDAFPDFGGERWGGGVEAAPDSEALLASWAEVDVWGFAVRGGDEGVAAVAARQLVGSSVRRFVD
jgi:hypothetical protein